MRINWFFLFNGWKVGYALARVTVVLTRIEMKLQTSNMVAFGWFGYCGELSKSTVMHHIDWYHHIIDLERSTFFFVNRSAKYSRNCRISSHESAAESRLSFPC